MKVVVTDKIKTQLFDGTYTPKIPNSPIPPGMADCFGLWNDPRSLECIRCDEFDTCAIVVSLRTHSLYPRKEK